MGSGKSWRTTGIFSAFETSFTSGAARAQSGHCRSSNTTMATLEPAGGFSVLVFSLPVVELGALNAVFAAVLFLAVVPPLAGPCPQAAVAAMIKIADVRFLSRMNLLARSRL